MEVTLTPDALVRLASLLTALGVISGAALWCFRFVERNRRQDEELEAIRREQQLICYGVMACLKGLAEQGCDGPVHEALDKLEKHLNQEAHHERT